MFKCKCQLGQATLNDMIFYELMHSWLHKTEFVHMELQHTTLLIKPNRTKL